MKSESQDGLALTLAANKKCLLQRMRALELLEKLAANLTQEEREDLRSIISIIKQ